MSARWPDLRVDSTSHPALGGTGYVNGISSSQLIKVRGLLKRHNKMLHSSEEKQLPPVKSFCKQG